MRLATSRWTMRRALSRTGPLGEAGVQRDGQNMGRADGESSGDGAGAGSDFDDGAARKIAQRGGYALDGLRIVEEVLSEPGFGGHGLLLMVDERGRLRRPWRG